MIKTLVVDDSPVARDIIRDFLESEGSFQVIGEAGDGQEGLEKALALNPDLITMDIDMPRMCGLEAIERIREFLTTPIVVISSHNTAKAAYEAARKGAVEFYDKEAFNAGTGAFKQTHVLETLKQIAKMKRSHPLLGKPKGRPNTPLAARDVQGVVIAASTGGPKALTEFCSRMPCCFPAPIILVQHNTTGFDKGFAQWLDNYTPLRVKLAKEGERPLAGTLYVAPTDTHLTIFHGRFILDDSAPVNNQKPAADILFKSAARSMGRALISVVLTGMGNDGAEGTRCVRDAGGITIAQDEASSMIYGMPKAALDTGCVDIVLPLDKIPERLVALTRI
ncbi:MAG: chemotaxis-specific protein-glutamate methyltransferase CheB [Treponema sp.]|jgi:two-component system chemotaxis response regulator CheB|nr:chemotaxis-specific protein-glutamate methyltransferase CheB [Treponema sp.]